MSNYGVATDSLPMFLGNECVIEHLKTLRLKYRDIHKDIAYHIDGSSNTITERKNDFEKKGWIDIANQQLPLDGLFAFIGVQTLLADSKDITLNLIKFRHYQGKTQARVTITKNIYIIPKYINLDNYVEIFIYRRLQNLTPNTGYGIHIYDKVGNLKYKDGLNLLNNIRRIPIYFKKLTNPDLSPQIYFDILDNPQLQNLGTNIAVLQTTHFIYTKCSKVLEQWSYFGLSATSHLKSNGSIHIKSQDAFFIGGQKKRSYPSYAKGGAYIDSIICADHVLVINKPT